MTEERESPRKSRAPESVEAGTDTACSPPPPERSFQWAWVFIGVGGLLAGAMLLLESELLVWLPFVGLPVALIAVVFTLVACFRFSQNDRRGKARRRGSMVLVTLVVAAALLTTHAMLVPRVWRATSEYSKSAVSEANLRGLGWSMKMYCQQHGQYPPSLLALSDAGLITVKQLIAPYDPNLPEDWRLHPESYQSYVYAPGAGDWQDEAEVILAFENGWWSPSGLSLFPKRGRWVLSGEGRVRFLDRGQFAQAKPRDANRRAELAWPSPNAPPTAD